MDVSSVLKPFTDSPCLGATKLKLKERMAFSPMPQLYD
jgi:hypothetical protein